MRTIHTRKRSRSVIPHRRVKRRRLGKRFKRSRAGFTTTSRALNANSAFKPRARRVRKSTWRRMLWRDTLQMGHFRSIRSQASSVVTPNDTINLNMTTLSALDSTTGTEFWKALGGAQDPSFGVTPQWQNPNGAGPPVGFDPITCVLRGGRLWLTAACQDGDSLTVRVQLIFVKQQIRNVDDTTTSNALQAWLTAIGGGPRPKSWDITTQPDFENYLYKPVIDKTIQLQQGQTVTTYFKIKPTKIDVQVFKVGGGWFPLWFVYGAQDMNVVAGAATCQLTYGHNLSFAVTDLPQ